MTVCASLLWPDSRFRVSLLFKPRVRTELIILMSKSLSKARNGLRMNGSSTVAVAKKRKRELLEEESDSESSSTQNESTSGSDSEMNSKDGNSEDDDAERFRASQWVDEDDLDPYEGMTAGTSNGGQVSFWISFIAWTLY
jgi:hypothetical protein